MPFFKIRTKLNETLPYLQGSGSGIALEHVLDAVGRVNPGKVTATYVTGDRTKIIIDTDIAELITLWKYGTELEGQDGRCHAMICKLLNIKV